jgi:alginate O-acetyltransferase complex protein AlgJ
MNHLKINKWLNKAVLACAFGVTLAHAADPAPVIIGKNDWLFTPYEFALAADQQDTQASIQLFEKINKLFEQKGITMTLVIVPSKIRIHADQLPDNKPLDSYTSGKYENIYKALRAGGVNVVNLNQSFLNSPHRTSDTPIFLRLDTHWSPAGAMLAAETVKAEIDANPALKAAFAATTEEKYTMTWAKQKANTRARDLVRLLPKDAPTFPAEQTLQFKVVRAQASQAGLLNAADNVGITAIGSSYTSKNTGYPDGLRYTLQRNLLDISLPVDQGPWFGMESYLKDDAFKTNKPKLIIWEIPEREMRSPPNNKFRDPRYVMDNNEWLSRVTALLK